MFACEYHRRKCVCVYVFFCVCVCVIRASSENRQGPRGDGGNEGQRERGGEIKEVTGEMVDGREGAG